MSQISKVECVLNHDLIYEQLMQIFPDAVQFDAPQLSLLDRLDRAINLYCMALSTLKVVVRLYRTANPKYLLIHHFICTGYFLPSASHDVPVGGRQSTLPVSANVTQYCGLEEHSMHHSTVGYIQYVGTESAGSTAKLWTCDKPSAKGYQDPQVLRRSLR